MARDDTAGIPVPATPEIAFMDLRELYRCRQAEVDAACRAVLASGQWILGEPVAELEAVLRADAGAAHCITCGSGTQALTLALAALGIGPGDEVITVPFTWISTVQSIEANGATPILVDIEPVGFTIDPEAVAAAVTPRTRAIMPVSLFGQCYDAEAIAEIAERHGLAVIEDAAQSYGATRKGRHSGTLSTLGCTSFYPTKPLACFGDGGAIFTDDADLDALLRSLRLHGAGPDGLHHRHGVNGRFDTIQAAMMLAMWGGFRERLAARRAVAAVYDERLAGIASVPRLLPGNDHVYAQYTLRVPARDRIVAGLTERGIPTRVYYQRCVHQQPGYGHLAPGDGRLATAEAACHEVLSLPMHPWLGEEAAVQVADAVAAEIAACEGQA